MIRNIHIESQYNIAALAGGSNRGRRKIFVPSSGVCFPEMWAFFVHVFLMLFARYFHFLAVFPDFISGSHNQGETGQNPQQAPEKERLWVIKAVLFWWDLLFVLT